LNRTVAALLGAVIIVAFGVVEQNEAASEFIDWNTIGLLAGMMIIVAILNKTGIFEYLAIKSGQWGKGRPGRILILLSVVTAVLSAFLGQRYYRDLDGPGDVPDRLTLWASRRYRSCWPR
jgi:Na+/H+ antiporter NhaD/arsenite permease-like protein